MYGQIELEENQKIPLRFIRGGAGVYRRGAMECGGF